MKAQGSSLRQGFGWQSRAQSEAVSDER